MKTLQDEATRKTLEIDAAFRSAQFTPKAIPAKQGEFGMESSEV